jgi:ketosteroid isomerase-like protein
MTAEQGEVTEVIAQWADALRRGDLGVELWSTDVEIVNAEGWVVETVYRGHEGLRRWWDDLAEAFSDFRMEMDEITPLDEQRALTVQRFIGKFRATEIPLDAEWASVITVKDGLMVHAIGYLTKDLALQATSK